MACCQGRKSGGEEDIGRAAGELSGALKEVSPTIVGLLSPLDVNTCSELKRGGGIHGLGARSAFTPPATPKRAASASASAVVDLTDEDELPAAKRTRSADEDADLQMEWCAIKTTPNIHEHHEAGRYTHNMKPTTAHRHAMG